MLFTRKDYIDIIKIEGDIMKLKELKPILNSERSIIYVGETIIEFEQDSFNEYIRENNVVKLNMFDVFGEFTVEQIYADDSMTINIELELVGQ